MMPVVRLWIITATLSLAWTAARAADESAEAKEILRVSGVRAGLCVHLGCGRPESPGLAAALAETTSLAVHGLALDDAALARARKAIEERKVCGRALAEKVECNPLPYLPDLVNLAVVEDLGALSKQGVTREEILRVVAPDGVLCVKEGGKWTRTAKPRPKEMDDWTHPFHGADGNMVSNDKLVKFPIGFRWIDGLPVNINMWAACRGWVIAGGRCYTLSSNELENIEGRSKKHYLAARDAFSGIPLWKINLETTDDGAHLTWRNSAPLAADEKRAYAVQGEKPIVVDGATGRIIATCETKYKPHRLALLDGVLLAACWESRNSTNDGVEGGSLWATWVPKSANGAVEAFEAASGKPKWSARESAYALMASDGVVYALTHVGNPKSDDELDKDFAKEVEKELTKELAQAAGKDAPKEAAKDAPKDPGRDVVQAVAKKLAAEYPKDSGKDVAKEQPWKAAWKKLADPQRAQMRTAARKDWDRQVVALDLKTGKEKWRVPYSKLGTRVDLELGCAGPGYVVVYKRDERGFSVLSAADGRILWQVKGGGTWTPVVDGLLWQGRKRYDPRTGEAKGPWPLDPGDQGCTPSLVVNNIVTRTRGCDYEIVPTEPGKNVTRVKYGGARGGCMLGMVPANGMFYTAQNNCRCSPAQIYGFLAIGPSGEWPAAADFEKPRAVEKGPAFGVSEENVSAAEDWPAFRHDAARSAATGSRAPEQLREAWRTPVAQPGEGPVAAAWKARLASCLSAPVVAGGQVYAAGTDAGQIVALDAVTGRKAWTAALGGRVDTPPTVYRGLCLAGAHDGFVYALRAKDGQLAWRARVAPWERRMAAYGQVESVWPAVGTVLVHENVAYANAGRTSESDGGIAVVALDPATGNQVWGKAIGTGPQRQNDLLFLRDGLLGWHHIRLDPKTGGGKPSAPVARDYSQGGIMDGTWTLVGKRRSGNAFGVGKPATTQASVDLLAWNQAFVASNSFVLTREKADAITGNPKPADFAWRPALPGGAQVEAIALAGNAVVYAGRITKGTQVSGFLCVFAAADGKKLAEVMLESPVTYDGLAVAREKIYVSLQNGLLLCFGK
jgi:outer membrane protein assembly factor BamB